MHGELPTFIYVALAVVVYFLFTNVLKTLASVHRHEISVHNLVRQSHAIRRQYVKELEARKQNVTNSAEVLED